MFRLPGEDHPGESHFFCGIGPFSARSAHPAQAITSHDHSHWSNKQLGAEHTAFPHGTDAYWAPIIARAGQGAAKSVPVSGSHLENPVSRKHLVCCLVFFGQNYISSPI